MFDLFQVATWSSFAVNMLRHAPKGRGSRHRIGCVLNTKLVEGINRIEVIERMARGFRNDA